MAAEPDGPGLARRIEHTLLSATATAAQVTNLCAEAVAYGFHAVCVNPIYVELACRSLPAGGVRVVSVAAFPLGATTAAAAAHEASECAAAGAREIDLVAPLGLAAAGEFAAAERFIATVRRELPGVTLKVILETGYFEPATLRSMAEVALSAGADFLKTSTGFGPRGASEDDVRLLVGVAGGRAGVKASGGIRTREQAAALIAAGATRLGTSRGVEIVTQRSSPAH